MHPHFQPQIGFAVGTLGTHSAHAAGKLKLRVFLLSD